jgi:hypothetical protein
MQLSALDGVLVWHNPIEDGRNRNKLDQMLRLVAGQGVLVSAHPDVILKLGTKDVLHQTRHLDFGSAVERVDSLTQLREELPARLAISPRVLKQHRGHSGIGVYRIEHHSDDLLMVQHAKRDEPIELLTIAQLLDKFTPYFANQGHMIDQPWQASLNQGMVRAYLVGNQVAGFGHQAINALYRGADQITPVAPGPRLYHKRRLEDQWLSELCSATDCREQQLPMLWDIDFFIDAGTAGNKPQGIESNTTATPIEHRYILCEINVSSVSPFPESALAPMVAATITALRSRCQ